MIWQELLWALQSGSRQENKIWTCSGIIIAGRWQLWLKYNVSCPFSVIPHTYLLTAVLDFDPWGKQLPRIHESDWKKSPKGSDSECGFGCTAGPSGSRTVKPCNITLRYFTVCYVAHIHFGYGRVFLLLLLTFKSPSFSSHLGIYLQG